MFIALLWIRFVVDWVQVFARSWAPTRHPLLVLLQAVYSTTDPPIKALRRVIPPLRIGARRAGPVVPHRDDRDAGSCCRSLVVRSRR